MAQLFWLSGQTLVDGNGAPYAAAKAYFYETGTTTAKATYSNAGLSSANANPVVADSDGRFGLIYLVAGRYKIVLTDANDVQVGDDLDPVDGVLALISAASAPSPTYAFMRYHNTSDGNVYRRNSANSAWINEGPVDGLGNAASVTQQLAGTATDAFCTPDSVAGLWQRGADIASASTLSLPAGGGGVFNITGTTGITGISSAQGGRTVWLKFAGALTLTNSGSFILAGGANITTAAGDWYAFTNDAAQDASGSTWRMSGFVKASGSPLNMTDFLATQAEQETGTSTVKYVTSGRQHYHDSAAKAWLTGDYGGGGTPSPAADSYNVSSVGDTGTGIMTVNFTTSFGSANYVQAGMCQRASTNSALWPAIHISTDPTASACAIAFVSDGATNTDPSFYSSAFHGDL